MRRWGAREVARGVERILPGIDLAATPVSGVTRDGQPLSLNRAPAPDLAPWIARMFVTIVKLPAGHRIDCGVLSDTSFVRLMFFGKWRAQTADGEVHYERAALFFGPQSRLMPVSVEGSFAMMGFGMRPGACHALGAPDVATLIDRIVDLSEIAPLEGLLDLEGVVLQRPEEALLRLEDRLRRVIAARGAVLPDPVVAQFDRAAFADPTLTIGDFAREIGIDRRRLERLVRRDFGMSPKQVLRRARVLDMASRLRGVADDAEAEALALRYYDQSHMIRDFQHFIGQTPTNFMARPQPILTLSLETRQARRLEELGRLFPGTPRPWEMPAD